MCEEEENADIIAERPGHGVLVVAIGIVTLVFFVLSPWLVDTSGPDPFYKGPLMFPLMVLGMTALAALPSAIRIVCSPTARSVHIDGHGFPRRTAVLFVLMCLYPTGIAALGLQAATFLVVLCGLLIVRRSSLQSLIIATGLTLAIHLIFRTFLNVWFPPPWIAMLAGN